MTRLRSSLVLLALAALAIPAGAQDAGHPLEAALTRQLRTAQFRASGRCMEIRSSLNHAMGAAFVDTNGNGKGELATIPEMLGLSRWRGRPEDAAGVMTWPGAFIAADGVVEADGYLYRIEFPGAGGEPTTTLSEIDAALAEKGDALIVAWPEHYGVTGTYTFAMAVNRPEGAVLVDAPQYSGVDAPPPIGAALLPRDKAGGRGVAAPLVTAGVGRDGLTWRPRTDEKINILGSTFSLPVSEDASWRDGQKLVDALSAAFTKVSDLAGVEDERGRPRLRFVDHEGMLVALEHEQKPLFERFGIWEQAQGALPLVALAVPAKYMSDGHVLLFAPRSLELAAHLARVDNQRLEDAVSAILVHEAVHAVDSALYDMPTSFAACRNEGDLLCWSAMSEGHAQQVARKLCAEAGISRGFDDMLRLLHDDDALRSAPEALRAALVTLSFPYVEGEQFLDAVLAADGQEAVDALMRTPPTRPAEIERPELWFARKTRKGPDLLEVLDRLRGLLPQDGSVHETPLLRASLAAMLEVGAGDRADEIASGVEDGQTRSAASATGTSQTVTTVLRCRDAAAAAAYVAASRAFQIAQDRQFEGNPALRMETKYEKVPGGFRNARSLRTAGGTMGGVAISVAVDHWVLEATLSRQTAANLAMIDRIDSVVLAAVASLRKKPASPDDE